MAAQLPCERIMNTAWRDKGWTDVVKIEVFPVQDGDLLKLTLEKKSSPWRQGVWLSTDDHLVVNQGASPRGDFKTGLGGGG